MTQDAGSPGDESISVTGRGTSWSGGSCSAESSCSFSVMDPSEGPPDDPVHSVEWEEYELEDVEILKNSTPSVPDVYWTCSCGDSGMASVDVDVDTSAIGTYGAMFTASATCGDSLGEFVYYKGVSVVDFTSLRISWSLGGGVATPFSEGVTASVNPYAGEGTYPIFVDWYVSGPATGASSGENEFDINIDGAVSHGFTVGVFALGTRLQTHSSNILSTQTSNLSLYNRYVIKVNEQKEVVAGYLKKISAMEHVNSLCEIKELKLDPYLASNRELKHKYLEHERLKKNVSTVYSLVSWGKWQAKAVAGSYSVIRYVEAASQKAASDLIGQTVQDAVIGQIVNALSDIDDMVKANDVLIEKL